MASVRTRARRLTQGFGWGLLTDESLNRLTDGVRSGLKDLGETQERNKNRLLDVADRAGYVAGRATRKGVIAAGRGVRAVGRGIGSAARAANRVRVIRDHGHVDDRNKKLPGFTYSANHLDHLYNQQRKLDKQKKRIQDSQSKLGISPHDYYSKTELGGGAVAGRWNRAIAQQNAQNKKNADAIARRKKLKNRKVAAAKTLRDSIAITGLAEISTNLNKIKTADLTPVMQGIGKVIADTMRANTPVDTGKLARSVTLETANQSGTVFYDPAIARYGLHIDEGTQHMRARHIRRRTIAQCKSQAVEAGITVCKKIMNV